MWASRIQHLWERNIMIIILRFPHQQISNVQCVSSIPRVFVVTHLAQVFERRPLM